MVSSINWEENPYIIGRPIYEPELFFGREDLFNFIQDNLNKRTQVILLHGQRRIGKSSVLSQISNFVRLEQFVFVLLSLEGKSQKPLKEVLHDLARDIIDHLDLSQNQVILPAKTDLEKDALVFCNNFLPQVYRAIDGKNLVLLLDEFDVLGDYSQDSAAAHFFPYLQSVIYPDKKLFIIPVVGRRLDDMPNLLSLFRQAPNQEIGLLDRNSAERLITKPAEGVLKYQPEAIDAILELSAGHPYFTQVLCFAVFSQAREEQRWQVNQADVYSIVDEAIEIGEAGLTWFRDGLPIPERVFLSAVAEVQQQKISSSANNETSQIEVVKGEPFALLQEYGVVLTKPLRKAEERLLEWNFLEDLGRAGTQVPARLNTYKVTVELVRRWLVKRYPLRREIWQLEKLDEAANIIYDEAADIYQRGEIQNALKKYKQVLKANPNHFNALFKLIEGCIDTKDFNQAVELYGRAYKVDPVRNQEGFVQVLLNYGQELMAQSKFEPARKLLTQAQTVQPSNTLVQEKLREIGAPQKTFHLDLERFYQACNPSRPLVMGNATDRKYYIDFASVRGGKIVEALEQSITRVSPDTPTCQLFTGHIGCGKSTELLRLKAELEEQNFHVVYFESTHVLEMADVDVTDILLAIADQVSESLEAIRIRLKPSYFAQLFAEIVDFLQTPIELEVRAELSIGIGKITAKTKESPQLRRRLRDYLEPRTENILHSINEELLQPANKELKARGKRGLVVIVDSLDRLAIRPLPSGRSLPEYLFIDRGEQLRQLNCHVIYTIPLGLTFSNDSAQLQHRLGNGVAPKVLPIIPVLTRSGNISNKGMALMRQMVLARAFPDVDAQERLDLITEVCDRPETLDRLCLISGGHLRDFLGLVFDCLREQDPPFSRDCVELVIQRNLHYRANAIDSQEWELIFQVVQQQKLTGDIEYQTLMRSLFVLEYRDEQGSWFAINPVLAETQKFKSWLRETNQKI
jgi:tetratricopeptide (TPR) repeat protein